MNNIEFIQVIPIFCLDIVETGFEIEGTYNDVRYKIEIITVYQTGDPYFSRINDFISSNHAADIYKYIFFSGKFSARGCNVVVVRSWHKYSPELAILKNSPEACVLVDSYIRAISLIATKGIFYENSYRIRLSPKLDAISYGEAFRVLSIDPIRSQKMVQNRFFGKKSILDSERYSDLRAAFNSLLKIRSSQNSEFGNAFNFAYDFFYSSRCVSDKKHSFLFLVLIVETLFKENVDDKFNKAASRMARFLEKAASIKYQETIKYLESNQTEANCRKIRNVIAHGKIPDDSVLDVMLDRIFFYAQSALLQLLLKENDFNQPNYFQLLEAYINQRP